MNTANMTTGEAEMYRAGQAVIRERHMLALTHLRYAQTQGDWSAVERARRVLGGACAAEPGNGSGGQEIGPIVPVAEVSA